MTIRLDSQKYHLLLLDSHPGPAFSSRLGWMNLDSFQSAALKKCGKSRNGGTRQTSTTITAAAKTYICCPEGKPNFPNVKLCIGVTFMQPLGVRLAPTAADGNLGGVSNSK